MITLGAQEASQGPSHFSNEASRPSCAKPFRCPMTSPSAALCTAVRSGDVTATRTLLAALPSSAPWPQDDDGHSALHWASMSDNPAILPLLLSALSSTRPVDLRATAPAQAGQTPLHWACVSGNVTAVQALLNSGADPAATDEKGYTAATHVVHYGRVDLLHMLTRTCPSLMAMADREGHTLLQWAAYHDHAGVVVYLLKVRCVDPSEPDASGMTPLHRAAQRGHSVVSEHLLRGGADFTARNAAGRTPEELVETPRGRTKAILRMWRMGKLTTARPVPTRHTLTKYGLVLFYWVLLVVSFVKYRQLLYGAMPVGVGMNIVFHVALVVSASLHLASTFGDPGEIAQGTAETCRAYIEKVLANGTSEAALVPSAYCFTCLAPRPPRSKHSRERDRCVRKFDHECPWVNNTVGLYTHRTLLLLVLSTCGGEWVFIYLVINGVANSPGVTTVTSALFAMPLLCMVIAMHFCISLFCVMLFLTHVQLVVLATDSGASKLDAEHARAIPVYQTDESDELFYARNS
ncbi:unnamed protein product [Chondrus crispus]|uniref:Palmitoyltransferase n=1 Tax=Chondrus crispus TaxID=2769 RepID=R7QHA0_CHOCR|nr:unnamed protein product [Chondrus crispus]CDF37897.1 unnamed protein product [Chondrus crispus]|eukprot:XP_005717768.1 unnamed protein product [Chondrus crispus]